MSDEIYKPKECKLCQYFKSRKKTYGIVFKIIKVKKSFVS